MPVSISAISSPKMSALFIAATPGRGGLVDTFDVARVVMRQLAGAPEPPGDLQEAEAHQIGAERHAQEDDPARHLQVGRDLVGGIKLDDELGAHGADDEGEERAAEQAEHDDLLRRSGCSMLTTTSTPTWMPVRTP